MMGKVLETQYGIGVIYPLRQLRVLGKGSPCKNLAAITRKVKPKPASDFLPI